MLALKNTKKSIYFCAYGLIHEILIMIIALACTLLIRIFNREFYL